jgi:hypothetical protein
VGRHARYSQHGAQRPRDLRAKKKAVLGLKRLEDIQLRRQRRPVHTEVLPIRRSSLTIFEKLPMPQNKNKQNAAATQPLVKTIRF